MRNHIRFSPAAVPKRDGGREDWEIITALTNRLGRGDRPRAPRRRSRRLDAAVTTPERVIDVAFALGPYGILRKRPVPEGADRGQGQEGPSTASTSARSSRACPARSPPRASACGWRRRCSSTRRRLDELAAESARALADGFDLTLIGRRQLRSNNSWMHNSARLMKGADRCTALLHPDDAAARGLADGDRSA